MFSRKSRIQRLEVKLAGAKAKMEMWKNVKHENHFTFHNEQEDVRLVAELEKELEILKGKK